MERYCVAVTVVIAFITACAIAYCAVNFKVSTDLTSMISDQLRFRQLEKELFRDFPDLTDTIVIVIDADTIDSAVAARKALSDRLSRDKKLFMSIYEPGSGSFFEKNGLLYLDVAELEKLSDRLSEAQPLIGLLSADYNIRGLFGVLETALKNTDKSGPDKRLLFLMDSMRDAFEAASNKKVYQMPWEGMMLSDKDAAAQRKQFIIIKPKLDATELSSGEPAILAVRKVIADAKLDTAVRVRLTGDIALAYEDYLTVMDSVGIATILSIVLVGLILIIGLGSVRLVIASLVTLIVGLIWTTTFAMLAIGSLNLISLTFAVLFVGLGIDYSIQFCLRYRELVVAGIGHRDAVMTTATGVGRGLLLSCITTALGFYAFLPTAYAGVAELGLISGTGMFISFIANLTVLPALLSLKSLKKARAHYFEILPRLSFVRSYSRAICIASLALAAASAFLLPRIYFDYNPLNLYSKSSESIGAIRELFENQEMPPWTISILAQNEKEAKDLSARLEGLKEVRAVATISDFVPDKQSEKLMIISDIALFMQSPGGMNIRQLDYEQKRAALQRFEQALQSIAEKKSESSEHIVKLLNAVRQFRSVTNDPDKCKEAFAQLENGLLYGLPGIMKRLDVSLHPAGVRRSDIPADISRQYLSPQGIYRVQVFPKENLLDIDNLAHFVTAVRTVAPNATDAPVTIYETGMAVTSSFKLATMLALAAVILVLLLELRSVRITILILLPLLLSILLTAAVSVIFELPLNYANVIVLPLLVGVGVHNGIMFMLRYLIEPPADGNMLGTSTARAIMLSSVTMVVSTGTLILSAHRGISSMGILLTVCFLFLLGSVLILLPALIEVFKKKGPVKPVSEG
jgi:hypothetical protein